MAFKGTWMAVAVGVLLGVPCASAQASSPSLRPDAKHLHRPMPQRTPPLAAQPSGPLPQVPLDQIPATPPQVNYQNGLLTIVADNSTLGDILREVHKRTGASIDVPQSATERVVTKLGPAPARDVLASLLNGSSFNYVMVGSTTDPASLSSVLLTPRPGGPVPPVTQTAAEVYQSMPVRGVDPGRPPGFAGRQPLVVQPQPNADENAEDAADAEDTDEDQNEGQQQGQADVNGAQQGVPQPNAGPKTPEQIMEMLRRPVQQPNGQPPNPPDNNQEPPE